MAGRASLASGDSDQRPLLETAMVRTMFPIGAAARRMAHDCSISGLTGREYVRVSL